MIIKDKNKLKTICDNVETLSEGEELSARLFKELGDKGIGLAANQIGITKRVCVVNVKEPIAFINPKITKLEGNIIFPESCLSFPKKVRDTKRARWVTVESDNHGTIVLGSDTDDENLLEAVCVQHEIDHLDGITMFDREFKCVTIKREGKKIGRNDKVTITKGSDSKIIKYKKAKSLLEDGWVLVGQ